MIKENIDVFSEKNNFFIALVLSIEHITSLS